LLLQLLVVALVAVLCLDLLSLLIAVAIVGGWWFAVVSLGWILFSANNIIDTDKRVKMAMIAPADSKIHDCTSGAFAVGKW